MQTRSAQPRQLLTIVTKSVTFSESRSFRGTPFRKACLKGGAGAVPAGELPIAPGRLWGTTRPAKGPVGGGPLDWTSVRQAKPLPLPRSRKHGSGAESADYGRFGEGRGRAPEGERAPTLARFRARAQVSGDTSLCGADSGRHAPFGAPLPS